MRILYGVLAQAGALVLARGVEAENRDAGPQGVTPHRSRGTPLCSWLTEREAPAGQDGRIGVEASLVTACTIQPYMMTYADEVAQRLELKAGRFDLISAPSAQYGSFGLSMGGVVGSRSLLNLQWHLVS